VTDACYLDTSWAVSIAFGESGHDALRAELERFGAFIASNLFEAELRATFAREGIDVFPDDLLTRIQWVMPLRPLTDELIRVLQAGYLRGGDAWHVACALYVSPTPADLSFLTMDVAQRRVAATLGFVTPEV